MPQLKETVVTATRTESRAGAVLADVTVITREDIERGTGRTLTEVIARQAGIQTASNGGLGKSSSLFIRGTENRHVLLLVDGVRYTSATAGTPPLDNIALESIERIEVLKGPASALYGSDAVGGVVQIFTRRGAPGFAPFASATLGSESRHEATTGLRGGSGEVSYAMGVQTLREKGFSATNPAVGAGFNRDRDGFSQQSFNGSMDWRFAPGWKADASLLYSDGTSHYDSGSGAFDTRADVRSQIYKLGVEGRLLPAWKSRLVFGRAEDLSTNFTGAPATAFNTEQDQYSWLNEIDTPLGKVLAGLERVEQRVSGTTTYTVNRRITDSVFAGLNGEAGRHSWQANLRHDSNSQFGSADTGLLGYGFGLAPGLRAHVSYGTSFKAPSFNTLYFPGFGNPTTQPERGRSAEIGASYDWGDNEVKLVRFESRIRGFITTAPIVTNIPQAKIKGWTLSYRGHQGRWAYRTALDLLDARNALNNLKLPRRADEQLTASVDYAVDAWKLGASVLAVTDRFDDVANRVRLGGFVTADLYADYALVKDWTLQTRLNNVGDKSYQTANGFNQPGRAVYVTLRWQPKSK
ncbi:TonB-dependent receptor domain-containing protein [Polaromonas sp.]|uniref:TonB-dependent receptor domain-containing protein n=1 Tax=Polaromonas sp. TaxID=1869339 RepID=UPI00356AA2F9